MSHRLQTERPDRVWMKRFSSLLPLLKANIPVMVWGEDAADFLMANQHNDQRPIHAVIPNSNISSVFSNLEFDSYHVVDTSQIGPASRGTSLLPLFMKWCASPVDDPDRTFAFPASSTVVLEHNWKRNAPYPSPFFIFIHTARSIHLDMSNRSRFLTLEALPKHDPRRKIRIPTLTALYDSLMDTLFEPPLKFIQPRLHSWLHFLMTGLSLDLAGYQDLDEEAPGELEDERSPFINEEDELLEEYVGVVEGLKEENRPYIRRFFCNLFHFSRLPPRDDAARERLELKNTRL